VIDASVALAWCFEDEATPDVDRILDSVALNGALVPHLWKFELSNVLLQAERKGRITYAEIVSKLAMIEGLPIAIDEAGGSKAWKETLELARSERLTVYDATYLELALRTGSPLATKDTALHAAAERRGVKVLAV
jgi:predicted nucleic acid-binding protein